MLLKRGTRSNKLSVQQKIQRFCLMDNDFMMKVFEDIRKAGIKNNGGFYTEIY